ncbi:hypothetical protein Tco_0763391 [Tanacetum coccineum]
MMAQNDTELRLLMLRVTIISPRVLVSPLGKIEAVIEKSGEKGVNVSVGSVGCDDSNLVNCSDRGVLFAIKKFNAKRFKSIVFLKYQTPVNGSNVNECDVSWKFRNRKEKSWRKYRDFCRFRIGYGEAQYLNRTFVMDLSICLSSNHTLTNKDKGGKDFRFYFDFKHLKETASIVKEALEARVNGGEGTSQKRETGGQNGQPGGHNGGAYSRLTKVEFPMFEGDEPNYKKLVILLQEVDIPQSVSKNVVSTPYNRGRGSVTKNVVNMPVQTNTVMPNRPFKKLTQKELEEKRAKQLCFYCDKKYSLGHKCSGQMYSLEVVACDEELESEDCEVSEQGIVEEGKIMP